MVWKLQKMSQFFQSIFALFFNCHINSLINELTTHSLYKFAIFFISITLGSCLCRRITIRYFVHIIMIHQFLKLFLRSMCLYLQSVTSLHYLLCHLLTFCVYFLSVRILSLDTYLPVTIFFFGIIDNVLWRSSCFSLASVVDFVGN